LAFSETYRSIVAVATWFSLAGLTAIERLYDPCCLGSSQSSGLGSCVHATPVTGAARAFCERNTPRSLS
jgi:hypothetical protein